MIKNFEVNLLFRWLRFSFCKLLIRCKTFIFILTRVHFSKHYYDIDCAVKTFHIVLWFEQISVHIRTDYDLRKTHRQTRNKAGSLPGCALCAPFLFNSHAIFTQESLPSLAFYIHQTRGAFGKLGFLLSLLMSSDQ